MTGWLRTGTNLPKNAAFGSVRVADNTLRAYTPPTLTAFSRPRRPLRVTLQERIALEAWAPLDSWVWTHLPASIGNRLQRAAPVIVRAEAPPADRHAWRA